MSIEKPAKPKEQTAQKPKVDVHQLMQGHKHIVLCLDDKEYVLSITRRGKLILTAA